MRAALTLPLLGAAVVTVGAVMFQLARCSERQSSSEKTRLGAPSNPVQATLDRVRGAQPLSLPERLREQGL